jgi:hypothetical protein
MGAQMDRVFDVVDRPQTRVLRVEAIAHNTHHLGCGRVPDNFPRIISPSQESTMAVRRS